MGGWKFTHFPRMNNRQCSQLIYATILAAVLNVAAGRRRASLRCLIMIQVRQFFVRTGVIGALAQLAETEVCQAEGLKATYNCDQLHSSRAMEASQLSRA
jgi:hypothetical protein